ncbi:T9SS type A sorting domain-containing protein [Paucihalobacter sp.]|uniref:T9SS type A sorting domain-containing protein n=1 Tax=Paucihalobacter sp. TaxID=2850405 RepID=UPI002FE10E3C
MNIIKLPIYIITLAFLQVTFAQDNSAYRIIRSNLGSSGSSQAVVTENGVYMLSQSVGQSSVIGTHTNNGYYLRQGYQQPMYKIKTQRDFELKLKAKIYPNPFTQIINIAFGNAMKYPIRLLIYDVHGKIVHAQEFLPAQNLQLILNNISSGSYLLKMVSNGKHYNAKLIKF